MATIGQQLEILRRLNKVDAIYDTIGASIRSTFSNLTFDPTYGLNSGLIAHIPSDAQGNLYYYNKSSDQYLYQGSRFNQDVESTVLVDKSTDAVGDSRNADFPDNVKDRDNDVRFWLFRKNLEYLSDLRKNVQDALKNNTYFHDKAYDIGNEWGKDFPLVDTHYVIYNQDIRSVRGIDDNNITPELIKDHSYTAIRVEEVHVGNFEPLSFLDSLKPSLSKRLHNLLDLGNNTIDDIIGDDGIHTAELLKNVTGLDVLNIKNNAVKSLQFLTAAQNSEDPFYGAKHGLNIGQTLGKYYETTIPGFYNSGPSIGDLKRGDPGYNLITREILKQGLKNLQYEDRASWYLPYTNPAQYTLDERLKYGWRMKPDKIDALDALGKVHDFFTDSENHTSLGAIQQSINKAANTIGNILGGPTGISSRVLGAVNPTDFLDSYLPPEAQQKDRNTGDKIIDLILKGGASNSRYGPLVALEAHANYVSNYPAGKAPSKWFTVDVPMTYQKDAGNYITEFAKAIYNSAGIPHMKTDARDLIITLKEDALRQGLIYEGVQQFDGSYKNIQYGLNVAFVGPTKGGATPTSDKFQPQSGQANLNHASYLAHVKSSKIQDILGETPRQIRRFDQMTAAEMAASEPQFFPFYFRTISRDDYALIQQPVYDNGIVVMSKRRVTGNSIVFLEACINDISEGFQSAIAKDQYLGRTEPVLLYQNTTRSFSLSFTIPITAPCDMPAMRYKVTELARMMYPQLLGIQEVGVFGYRRAPMIELVIGDMYFLYGMIETMNIKWGGETMQWETLPGGRFLRGAKIDITLVPIHPEQPGAHTDFWSPKFKDEIFCEDDFNMASLQSTGASNPSLPNIAGINSSGINPSGLKDIASNALGSLGSKINSSVTNFFKDSPIANFGESNLFG